MRQTWLILVLPVVLILLVGLWSLLAAPVPMDETTARVRNVVDGDTIDVWLQGRVERIRYLGMNAPESYEVGFAEATQANRALVQGQRVRLEYDTERRERVTHRRPRLLAYVWVGDVMVNAELVRQGYARPMLVWPNVKYAAWFDALAR